MAFAEVEILRMLVDRSAPGGDDITATAYRLAFERRAMPMGNRAEARGVAHVAMFASSFGQVLLLPPPGFAELLDKAIPRHLDDTDTLGELLIAAHAAGLDSAHIKAGRAAFDVAVRAIERTFRNYHVFVVAGILYALTE